MDEISDVLVSHIRDRVLSLAGPEVNERLMQLARFERPTVDQRLEHRLLSERQIAISSEMGQQVAARLAGNPNLADRSMGAPNPVPGGPAGHGGWLGASGDRHVQEHRTAAMRALDRHRHSGVLNAAAADRADTVLRRGDPQGLTARYLAACGAEAYGSAFGKMVADPLQGHLRFSPAEVEAVRDMSAAQDANRIMGSALTTGTSGFPLPITVDPSIVITGAGALNPVRDISNVITVGTHDWVGVSTDAVTAGYVAEGTEASDASPTLAGPKIHTQQGRAFCGFSIEASQDWDTLSAQLVKLVADARNVVNATMFLSGDGTNQPFGILGGDATYSLTTTERVLTATTATYAVGDPWSLKAALPARFVNSATFAAAPSVWDATYRFVAQGSTTEPRQFANGDRGGDFLGRPKVEWSTMDTAVSTTGKQLIVAGDFKAGFKIVDRLGMQAELIPHMFGTSGNLPNGTRGLYCYWRTGAAVTGQNAFRYLEVK